ncbi:MAG: mitochondrial large ribosomal subunit protein uL30m [Armatimonadetes bacterium]|nr:mitochondrial large ribosomal subunit protein uL30m [Armatimonadota bacterium]
MTKHVRITLRRSLSGSTDPQRGGVATLGLRRIGQSTVRATGPQLDGLLRQVGHLVSVEPATAPDNEKGRA